MTFRTKIILNKYLGYLKKLLLYAVLLAGVIFMAFPFAWMASTSLKGRTMIFAYPPQLIPKHPWRWQNYKDIFRLLPFAMGFVNSFKVAIINTVGTLLSSTMAAFGFAKLRFRFNNKHGL